MKFILFLACLIGPASAQLRAQNIAYSDAVKKFRDAYIQTHPLVAKENKKHFQFFPIKQQWAILCRFERLTDSVGILIKNTGKGEEKYFRYGKLYFTVNQKPQQLTIFQSPLLMKQTQYVDYLFVPFTDATTGKQTYGSGRYIDLRMGDIQNGTLLLDFNKAYNPYCAYMAGFACPIPPKENRLAEAIRAGEKNWGLHLSN